MDILAGQSQSKALARAAQRISSDIKAGTSLSQSMKRQGPLFSDLYCNMVSAGESSGSLSSVLGRLAEYLEKSSALRRKVQAALAYPAALCAVAVAASCILFTYVVPKFADMFGRLGGELPAATRTVMAVSSFAGKYWIALPAALLFSGIALNIVRKTERAAYLSDRLLLAVPVIGDLIAKSVVSRFSQTLETLLKSGIPLIDALTATAKTAGNKVLEKCLLAAVRRVTAGSPLHEPLVQSGLFPPMVTDMIAVGEKTGDLPSMLNTISAFYKNEVDSAVEAIASLIEPVMIVIMGAVFGAVLYAMYMPMFEIINAVG
jgi:type IV pilus assembly protein PilC